MAQILSCSIDVKKIDKSKLIPGKNGAMYLNLQLFVNDEKDTYGNNIDVAMGQTKEERERKDKKIYLGNGREIWKGTRANPPVSAQAPTQILQDNPNDDLPF